MRSSDPPSRLITAHSLSMASKANDRGPGHSGLVQVSLQDNDGEILAEIKFYKNTPLVLFKMFVTQVLLLNGSLYFDGTLIGPKSKYSLTLESLNFKSDIAVFKLVRYKIIVGQLQDLKLYIGGAELTLHNVPSSFTVDLLRFMIECEHEIPMQNQVLKYGDKRWIHDSKSSYICARREVKDLTVEDSTRAPSPTLKLRRKGTSINVLSAHHTKSVDVNTPSPKTDKAKVFSKPAEDNTPSPKTDMKSKAKVLSKPVEVNTPSPKTDTSKMLSKLEDNTPSPKTDTKSKAKVLSKPVEVNTPSPKTDMKSKANPFLNSVEVSTPSPMKSEVKPFHTMIESSRLTPEIESASSGSEPDLSAGQL